MTREETLAIMSVLKAAFPSYYRDMSRQDAEAVIGLWQTQFYEPAQLVAMAVHTFINADRKGFPPTIGQIKDIIAKAAMPAELAMTEQEAWALINKATRNAAYNAEEEFYKLSPLLQRLVGTPSQLRAWALMDEDKVASVVASNFQRSYRAIVQQEKETLALPADIREGMKALAAGLTTPLLEEGDTK